MSQSEISLPKSGSSLARSRIEFALRDRRPPERYGFQQMNDEQHKLEMKHNLPTQMTPESESYMEYDPDDALVVAQLITDIMMRASANGASFAQQYMLKKGLKKFGDRGLEASHKELDQLHHR